MFVPFFVSVEVVVCTLLEELGSTVDSLVIL